MGEEKEIRDKMVHIAFTKSEKEEIKKYAENMTSSEFIRQAIRDKIMRIENPELFQERISSDLDNKQLTKLLEMTNESSEKINLILEKFDTIVQIENTLKVLGSMVERPVIEQKQKVIIELLKTHDSLKPKKLMELSGFSKEEIYDIISNSNIFSIDIKTGGVKLND